MSVAVDFSPLDTFEIRVFQELDGAELRAAVELVSPSNKDREGSRRTFAAKCAGYLQHGIGLAVIDVVTSRSANLHASLTLGEPLPTLPLWLRLDLCVPLDLEDSYLAACRSLRIPA